MIPRLVCDFCSDLNPVCQFVIPAGGKAGAFAFGDDGMAEINVFTDDGHWAACAECRDNILAVRDCTNRTDVMGFMLSIVRRSFNAMMRNHPDTPEILATASISQMHGVFWNGYDGSEPQEL